LCVLRNQKNGFKNYGQENKLNWANGSIQAGALGVTAVTMYYIAEPDWWFVARPL
jgi:hypothetical protein